MVKEAKRILYFRLLVTGSLLLAATGCALGAYYYLSNEETDSGEDHFTSISKEAFANLDGVLERMKNAAFAVSTIYAYSFSQPSSWPNVVLPGFYETSAILEEMAEVDSLLYLPIVSADEAPTTEAFLINYWNADSAIPASSTRSFWQLEGNNLSSAYVVRDLSGSNSWGGNKTILAPIAQALFSEVSPPAILGLNVYSGESWGRLIESIMDCVDEKQAPMSSAPNCSATTAFEFYPLTNQVMGHYGIPIIPIYGNEAVGILGTLFEWANLLSDVFPEHVTGIEVEVICEDIIYRYYIKHGIATLRDPSTSSRINAFEDNEYRQDITLSEGATFTVVFYPTVAFIDHHRTQNPLYAALAVGICFLVCCGIFIGYDYVVRGEFVQKDEALDTKRRYVRYSSHEMRRPLNTVRLGLQVLEMEFDEFVKEISSPFADAGLAAGGAGEIVIEWMKLLKDMIGNSETAVDVLNDLLNYDEIESCTLRLDLSAISIWDVVRKTAQTFTYQAQQKNIGLRLSGSFLCNASQHHPHQHAHPHQHPHLLQDSEGDEEDGEGLVSGAAEEAEEEEEDIALQRQLYVVGDSTRLGQVLRKLVSDALKFTMEKGSVTVTADWIADGMMEYTPRPQVAEVVSEQNPDQQGGARAGSVRIEVASMQHTQQYELPAAASGSVAGSSSSANQMLPLLQPQPPGHRRKDSNSTALSLNQVTASINANGGGDVGGGGGGGGGSTPREEGGGGGSRMTNSLANDASAQRADQAQALGIFISKGIIEQHGGKVTVDSCNAAGGVTFVIELPLFRNERISVAGGAADGDALSWFDDGSSMSSLSFEGIPTGSCIGAEQGHWDLQLQRQQQQNSSKQLLIVEDDMGIQELMVRAFHARGYECETAANGIEAISICRERWGRGEPADAILMDYQMPGMDGPEVIRTLRELGIKGVIVGITDSMEPEDVEDFKSHGADAVLPKPVNIDVFESLLAHFQPLFVPQQPLPSPQQQPQRRPSYRNGVTTTTAATTTTTIAGSGMGAPPLPPPPPVAAAAAAAAQPPPAAQPSQDPLPQTPLQSNATIPVDAGAELLPSKSENNVHRKQTSQSNSTHHSNKTSVYNDHDDHDDDNKSGKDGVVPASTTGTTLRGEESKDALLSIHKRNI